jgi:ribosome biogenesis GTPase
MAWWKLPAEAHRQELRADARARALEHARLRAVIREFRPGPGSPRR